MIEIAKQSAVVTFIDDALRELEAADYACSFGYNPGRHHLICLLGAGSLLVALQGDEPDLSVAEFTAQVMNLDCERAANKMYRNLRNKCTEAAADLDREHMGETLLPDATEHYFGHLNEIANVLPVNNKDRKGWMGLMVTTVLVHFYAIAIGQLTDGSSVYDGYETIRTYINMTKVPGHAEAAFASMSRLTMALFVSNANVTGDLTCGTSQQVYDGISLYGVIGNLLVKEGIDQEVIDRVLGATMKACEQVSVLVIFGSDSTPLTYTKDNSYSAVIIGAKRGKP